MDLGPGECEGYLNKKNDKAIGSKWSSRMWFVLQDYALYFYKDKTVRSASFLSFLIFPLKTYLGRYSRKGTNYKSIVSIVLVDLNEFSSVILKVHLSHSRHQETTSNLLRIYSKDKLRFSNGYTVRGSFVYKHMVKFSGHPIFFASPPPPPTLHVTG